jgi:hypothetical protein
MTDEMFIEGAHAVASEVLEGLCDAGPPATSVDDSRVAPVPFAVRGRSFTK